MRSRVVWIPTAVLLAALLGAIGFRGRAGVAAPMTPSRLPIEGRMPPLGGATAWINSSPLTAEGLRGKVVVVDFWTYTCVNWLRTLPYVRAWAAKYGDRGLVVIGVHTPEFSVERDVENVRRAARAMRVDYPIAVDTDYAVWKAFHNEYWPALYLVDAQGRIRFHHFGEGRYEASERAIQELLSETGEARAARDLVTVDPRGPEVAADWSHVRSEETYVGYGKAEGFASPGGLAPDTRRAYAAPAALSRNQWALTGEWTVGREEAVLEMARGRIAYRFHARDLNLVVGPGAGRAPVRFRVLLDGHAPGPAHGTDVDPEGNGALGEPRLYQLIRQPAGIEDRLFEIEFADAGAEAFVFTFG